MRGAGAIAPARWVYGLRLLSGQIPRATWRNTLMYRASDDLQLGVEYNPLADDTGVLANVRLQRETARRPAVVLGTSSDRIGTPYGRAYYGTVSKDLETVNGWRFAPYAGLSYGEFDHHVRFPFGARIPLGRDVALQPTFDGRNLHMLLSTAWKSTSATLVLVRTRDPGVAFTVGF